MRLIQPGFSSILDAGRALAATGVVISHLHLTGLASFGAELQPYGHVFVVYFFVLSGYVIAATASNDWRKYASQRLARMVSVAVPCLLLCAILELVGSAMEPAAFSRFSRAWSWIRYAASALFLNEHWFLSMGPPMDKPVWSLAYEFWYYVLFGVAIFVPAGWRRTTTLIAISGFIGPKILALMPVWLTGVGLWHATAHREKLKRYSPALLIGGGTASVALIVTHFRFPDIIGRAPWFFSASCVSDCLFGLSLAAVLAGLDGRWGTRKFPDTFEIPVRGLANFSFTLYLLHFPLMAFIGQMLDYDHSNPWIVASLVALVFAISAAIGRVIEPQRRPLSQWLRALLARPAAATVSPA